MASPIKSHGMSGATIAQPHSQQTSSSSSTCRNLSNLLSVGTMVDVCFDDIYFSATIISSVSYSKKVTVQYNTLFEEDGSTPLREEIDYQCLRPSPAPQEIVKGFEPGDVVDAFYLKDWWNGVVSEVREGEEKRYVVVFQNLPNALEFTLSNLRVHSDWINGNWICSHKKVKTLNKDIAFSGGMVVEESINPQDNHIPEEGRKHHEQGLPFVKNSILWKTHEAMDPFQRIPQNPHFQPLQHIKEILREGEALSYMVTFAGVVEKIHGLQFGDPKRVTGNILEVLAELENHGFNVNPIKDRVSELLVVKEKGAILVVDVKEIHGRILEHRKQKDKVEEEIEGIKEEIQKMEQKLLVLESAKEKDQEGETAAAVHCMKKIEEHIEDVKLEFEGIASSSF